MNRLIDIAKSSAAWLNNAITDEDGALCAVRTLGLMSGGDMMYKFHTMANPDFISFAGGVSAILGALAAKNYAERKTRQEPPAGANNA